MAITTCVFDAYGTLFDIAAAARIAADEDSESDLAHNWPKLAEIWRAKQLQYSWLRAVAGVHTDFWEVTRNGLDFALEALGLQDNPALRDRLLHLYWELQAYPEVSQMLQDLQAGKVKTAILSNGSPDMLDGAVRSAGIGNSLDAILSVEKVGVFKPHKSVYELVEKQFFCLKEEVLFVSSNCWDVAAAAGFGFQTAWVNRAGDPMERLPWVPKHIMKDLSGIAVLASGT
ncbi:MAG: haloacid dehalogenase type II [Woeseiaceae bacterium]|jgi:2-haloacid dehalogenase|nr:haloacid dehalogenase type II [Woeseiaceae bacterium]